MGVPTSPYNVSAAYAEVWQGTIERLQQELENARDMPAWAIAVVVLCAVSTFCVLVVCGFGCGLLVQQNYNNSKKAAAEHSRVLLSSDSALHSPTGNGVEEDTASAEGNPRVVARMSSKKAGKRVKAVDDDMEL